MEKKTDDSRAYTMPRPAHAGFFSGAFGNEVPPVPAVLGLLSPQHMAKHSRLWGVGLGLLVVRRIIESPPSSGT